MRLLRRAFQFGWFFREAAGNVRVEANPKLQGAFMTYSRFEDLPVWKAAMDLADRIYLCTRARLFAPPGDLRDQLRRAALSISNNIAEGFERGSTAELIAFLYIARGSAGEVRSMLHFAARLCANGYAENDAPEQIAILQKEIAELIALAESRSRQLRGWADSLQNSEIKGQRHLNEQTKAAYQSARRAGELQARIEEMNRKNLERWIEKMRAAEQASKPAPEPPEPEARE